MSACTSRFVERSGTCISVARMPCGNMANGRGRAMRGRVQALAALAIVACAWAALLAAPASAMAADYTVPNVDIKATVQPDGGLAVEERRTFEFTDDVNGVFWDIPLAENQQGIRSGVQVTGVEFPERTFRQVPTADPGNDGVYTVEDRSDAVRVKVFAPQESGNEKTVTLRYTLTGAVMAWNDTAELYWKFVGPDWDEDSMNVSLTVAFGGQTGIPAGKGDVRAWGHGQLDATVELAGTPEAQTVECAVPVSPAGEFSEVRAVFPRAWVPGLAPAASDRLPVILDEEARWAEGANAEREHARMVTTISTAIAVVVPAVVLMVAVWAKRVAFRSPEPAFKETYFRDVPSDDHPAVLSAFMNGGSADNDTFVATLMKLADERVVQLVTDDPAPAKKGLFKSKQSGYRLRLLGRACVTDPIDRAALDVYFGPQARPGDEVAFDALSEVPDGEAKDMSARMDEFKATVAGGLEERSLVDTAPSGYKLAMFCLGAAMIVVLVVGLSSQYLSLMAMLLGVAITVIMFITVGGTSRYSAEAVELRERCLALRRWFEDFTNLDEAVPMDVVLWDKMLVLAVAFGVSDKVLEALASAVPRETTDMERDAGCYYGMYWWCYGYHGHASPAHEMRDSYRLTVSNVAASLGSSGSGFGGGFSGGGGGGVGGGGGGTF